jgi:ABC-type branched-subunit amino acid transport system permease subunit
MVCFPWRKREGFEMIRALAWLGFLLCLSVGLLFPWSKTPLIMALCYGMASMGVAVMMRAGQVSFGHALYAAIAAYSVAFTARSFPQWDGLLLLLIGVLASSLSAALIGLFVVRYRGIFFGMLNLALSMVVFSMLGKFYSLTGGTDGLRINRPTLFAITLERDVFETSLLILSLCFAALLVWGIQRYFKSASGEALAGIKSNETRLEYLGLSAKRILWNAYILSAALVGLSGALFGLVQGLVTPDIGSWFRSGEYVFITILGGSGHALGAFLGAAVFEAVKLFAAAYMTGVWQLILGVTLIIVILVAPEGIVGLLQKNRQSNGGAA